MKAKLFFVLLVSELWAGICVAQSVKPLKDVAWGSEIEGVKLSISLTNSSINIGSKEILLAEVTNSSDNPILLNTADITIGDFTVYLIDDSKNKHTIVTPSGIIYAVMPPIKIDSREAHSWLVPLKIGNDVKPGGYWLMATRQFRIFNNSYTLESNVIRVQIE